MKNDKIQYNLETPNVDENQRLRMSRYHRCSCKCSKDTVMLTPWGFRRLFTRLWMIGLPMMRSIRITFTSATSCTWLAPCWSVFTTWPLLTRSSGGLSLEQVNRTVRDSGCCRKWEHMQIEETGKQLTSRYFERDELAHAFLHGFLSFFCNFGLVWQRVLHNPSNWCGITNVSKRVQKLLCLERHCDRTGMHEWLTVRYRHPSVLLLHLNLMSKLSRLSFWIVSIHVLQQRNLSEVVLNGKWPDKQQQRANSALVSPAFENLKRLRAGVVNTDTVLSNLIFAYRSAEMFKMDALLI